MPQQPEELSGDYEYDLAHEARGRQGTGGTGTGVGHTRPATVRTQVELDQDMSYDEAHDF